MGIPQGTDRVRVGPTEALRAVFVGIGRIIMAADRPQANGSSAEPTAATERVGRNGKAVGRGRRARTEAAPVGPRWRSLDETGNVRLLTAEDLDDGYLPAGGDTAPASADAESAEGPGADAESPDGPGADAESPDGLGADAESPDGPGAAELPLGNYDTLSLASIRARLRTLDAAQLRVLVIYEQAHAERPEVLGMLERRIEKLETGG